MNAHARNVNNHRTDAVSEPLDGRLIEIITIKQMQEVVKHIALDRNEPVMFVGPSGAGKTEGIDQVCATESAVCHHMLLGQYDTVDLRGTPWAGKLSPTFTGTVWHPASTLPFVGNPQFSEDYPIVLFLDEMTSASVPVMGICYQLINERCIGEHKLMPNVRIVCAGNRAEDKGIVNRMPKPLCNRMTWYEIGINVPEWCDWAQATYGKDAEIFNAFLGFRRPLIHTFDPQKPENVFATPRTIAKAIGYHASTTMPDAIKHASICGAVGRGWKQEFDGFVDNWQAIVKIMPAIKADPARAPVPDEVSLCYAAAVMISGSLTVKNIANFFIYLKRMDAEFVVMAMQLATKRVPALIETPSFEAFSKIYKAVWN